VTYPCASIPITAVAQFVQSAHDAWVQQRDLMRRLTIIRLPFGASSMAMTPRLSASLMAARALVLPTLARLAIWATERVHSPVALASFWMTASTAIALVPNKAEWIVAKSAPCMSGKEHCEG
jgi:hypothetical protein